ncbi:hypothetical protein F444_01668 [Phytophthora nicotianae P1976]|uniref:Integrase catalytic domain-containing protein n=1 Tax=Phytophthora nicotianae P1976 TaxID=1317066 RepID=A0A081AZV7_PHYNI|nr:hypothetical protein F444_01668 [Phytophthora nicotianae P1976]
MTRAARRGLTRGTNGEAAHANTELRTNATGDDGTGDAIENTDEVAADTGLTDVLEGQVAHRTEHGRRKATQRTGRGARTEESGVLDENLKDVAGAMELYKEVDSHVHGVAQDETEQLRAVHDGRAARREQTLQLTDDNIIAAQKHSKLVQDLLTAGKCRGQKVSTSFELVVVVTTKGSRVGIYELLILKRWVAGCQECGSRKSRPRQVIPPLRSIRGGDVGDRWALDVAGPLPANDGARGRLRSGVLDANVVLKLGPFRELLRDGASELRGKVIEELVILLQADQVNPVPYRPQMVGMVERVNRTWKDIVATCMSEETQRDWESWVDFAVYSYNS